MADFDGGAISNANNTITLSSETWDIKRIYDFFVDWYDDGAGHPAEDNFMVSSPNNKYTITNYRIILSGSAILNHDPDQEHLTFNGLPTNVAAIHVATGGTYNFGQTYVDNDATTYAIKEGLVHNVSLGGYHGFNAVYRESAAVKVDGGTFNWDGGIITSPGSVAFENGNVTINEGYLDVSGYNSTSTSIGPAIWAEQPMDLIDLNNWTIKSNPDKEGLIIQISKTPDVFDNIHLINCAGVGFGGITINDGSGNPAPIEVKNLRSTGATWDSRFWRNNYQRMINFQTGSDIKVSGMLPSGSSDNRGLIDVFKEVRIQVNDSSNTGIGGVHILCVDTDDGNRPADYRGQSWSEDRTYTWNTDSSGLTSGANEILLASFVKRSGSGFLDNIETSYRGITQDTQDQFVFNLYHYNYMLGDFTNTLSGNGEVIFPTTLISDPNITEQDESVVAAYTGISISHTAKRITLTSGTWDAAKIYDYCKYNKCLPENVQRPSISDICVMVEDGYYHFLYPIEVQSLATLNVSSDFPIRFDASTNTTTMYGSGTINIGNTTTNNGVLTYDSGDNLVFDRVGTSWHLSEMLVFQGNTLWNGGTIDISAPIDLQSSSNLTVNKGTINIRDHSLSSPYEIQVYSDTSTFNDFTLQGRGTLVILGNATFNKVTTINSDGFFPASVFSKADTQLLEVRDYSSQGAYNDHVLWRRSRIKWINSVAGSDLIINGKESGSSAQHTGISEFHSEFQITVTDSSGVLQPGVSYCVQDYDDGKRTNSSNLTGSSNSGHYNMGFDYTPSNTITGVTDSNGVSPVEQILIAVVDRTVGGAQQTPDTDWSYRSKFGTSSDEFEFHSWQYGKQGSSILTSLKGSGVKQIRAMMVPDINITEPDVDVVAAYTGIGVNHITKVISITQDTTLAQLYDYLSYNKSLQANVQYPTPGTSVARVLGSQIDIGDYHVNIHDCHVRTTTGAFSLIRTTGTITLLDDAILEVPFLDSQGDSLVLTAIPNGWDFEGVYSSLDDAKLGQVGGATRIGVSSSYKWLASGTGGNRVWFRIDEVDGDGVAFDDYTLPSVSGIYNSAVVTSTEETILDQVRSISREIKALVEAQAGEITVLDTKVDTIDTNVGTIEANQYTATQAALDVEDIQDLSKRPHTLVVSGTAYDGFYRLITTQEINSVSSSISANYSSTSSATAYDPTYPVYVSDNGRNMIAKFNSNLCYTLGNIQNSSNQQYYISDYGLGAFHPELVGTVYDRSWYTVTGKSPAIATASGAVLDADAKVQTLEQWIADKVDNIETASDAYTATQAALDVEAIEDISARPSTLVVSGSNTYDGFYRLMTIAEIEHINLNIMATHYSQPSQESTKILPEYSCYIHSDGKSVVAQYDGNLCYTLGDIQNLNDAEYYISDYGFGIFADERIGIVYDRKWYAVTGQSPAIATNDLTLSPNTKVQTLEQWLADKVDNVSGVTDQLVFTGTRVDANIPDQLTESEYDSKTFNAMKGWR